MPPIDPQLLKPFACKYIWWKTPEDAVTTPERVMAQVMDIGDYADVQTLAVQVGDEALRDVLAHAQAGQFSERSWAYWHYRLGLSEADHVPALPARRFVPCGGTESEHVKVSFFGTIAFGRVGEPDWTEDGVLQVASLDDLMATKVKVVLQRAEAKDYRDVAAMLGAGVSLARGLASARQLYGPNFQPSESLKALVYFNDGDLGALTSVEKKTLIDAVKAVRDLPEVTLRSKFLSGQG